MTSRRALEPHRTAYTTGEKVVLLSRQLLLLREALIRTAHHPIYYPELFRALRVLLIDPPPGRLGELAQALGVSHCVECLEPWEFRERGTDDTPDADGEARLFRSGVAAILEPTDPSRWKQLRGLPVYAPRPLVRLPFSEYLDRVIVGIKPEYQAQVSRRSLIVDVSNSRDVAHADPSMPTYLQAMQALGPAGPHYLVVAQEAALETLTFGRLVLEAAGAQYPDQIGRALRYEFAAPSPACGTCGRWMPIDEFICVQCGATQLPPLQLISNRQGLESMVLHGRILEKPTGSLHLIQDVESLVGAVGYEVVFLDIAVDAGQAQLYRSADRQLVWRLRQGERSRSVSVAVPAYPEHTKNALLMLSWSPDEVAVSFGGTSARSTRDQVADEQA
jgi:hypothetical protein